MGEQQQLSDAQLLELFNDKRADLSLLTPDEQSRLVKLTEPKTPAAQPSYLSQVGTRFVNAVKHVAGSPTSGATIAALAAAPFTEGMSLIPAMLTSGAAAGAGATPAALATGNPTAIAKEAAGGAMGEAAAPVVRMAARGLYRAAALPINKLGKYGDLIQEGLDQQIPVSKSGLQKVRMIAQNAAADKSAALADADQRLMYRASDIANAASGPLADRSTQMVRAGFPDPTPAYAERLAQFQATNPNGTLTPSALDAIKSTIDDTTGGAWRKIRAHEPLTTDESGSIAMSDAARDALRSGVPNYDALNKAKMTAEGLRQLIARRTGNGSGANQGLENALTMLGGVHALPARIAMLPPVLSRTAIGVNTAGPLTLKAALLAAMGWSSPDSPEQ